MVREAPPVSCGLCMVVGVFWFLAPLADDETLLVHVLAAVFEGRMMLNGPGVCRRPELAPAAPVLVPKGLIATNPVAHGEDACAALGRH